ncbi:MAG: hypothetical protein IT446_08320 [Phycisphaerales bacterium]|nr:hypothetical protein [Phycisphaerales bacterium]
MPVNNAILYGSSRVDITPELGTHLAGDGAGVHRPAREILDRLYATAAVFEAGGRRICIISLDLVVVMEPWSRQVRQAVAEALGIEPSAVLICATQTHSAPSMGYFMLPTTFPIEGGPEVEYLRGTEDRYTRFVVPRAIEAGIQAGRNLRPVELGYGRGMLGDFTFNCRAVDRDHPDRTITPGWYGEHGDDYQPLGHATLAYLEGPIDPEVGVMSIRAEGHIQGLLLHHTCHPSLVFKQRPHHWKAASSDWCGVWCEQMISRTGADCLPMVINGACGNITGWHPYNPDFKPDHRRMGSALADVTDRILKQMQYASGGVVECISRTVSLPYRDIPPQRSAEVQRILSENPQPPWRDDGSGVDPAWFRAASTRCVEIDKQRSPTFNYEIQVFRIGDLAVVGLPGEPFVQGQLAIKVQSPARYVQVAHMASHYIGYLPTLDATTRDGHQTNSDVTYWAKLAPGALETVVEAARGMIDQLFSSTMGAA